MAEPLTPEEERRLRLAVETGLVVNGANAHELIASLLATLDVARAAAPLDVETVTAAWTAAGALTNGRTDFLMELTNELNARLTEDTRRG